MQSPVCVQGRPSVALPPLTHDVAPVVSFVTSHVSFAPHPHCGTRPQRLFGGTVVHCSLESGTLASALLTCVSPLELLVLFFDGVFCSVSRSSSGSCTVFEAHARSMQPATTAPITNTCDGERATIHYRR